MNPNFDLRLFMDLPEYLQHKILKYLSWDELEDFAQINEETMRLVLRHVRRRVKIPINVSRKRWM